MKSTMLGLAALTLVFGVAVTAEAQRRGAGPGAGRGAGAGACIQARQSQGAGLGTGGGWWLRVNPKTEEQKHLVATVTQLHEQIRATNLEIARLRAANADAGQIAQQEAKVHALRQQLMEATRKGESSLRAMGVPAPYGVCDGTGPKRAMGGRGQGGRGQGGAGSGQRLRDGTGPNCPLR